MALVTIQRSPSPSNDPDSEGGDVVDGGDGSSGRSPLRQRSLSESYFTIKGAALILPHRDFVDKKTHRKQHGGDIQHDLHAMLHLLRPEDKIKVAIKLESVEDKHHRYMAVVVAMGRQDTEETVILGIDCFVKETSIGLVLPIYGGTKVTLDGDGGFCLYADDRQYLFKPVSVQAMWSALQSLDRAIHNAEEKTYLPGGLTHTWVSYYQSKVDHSSRNRLSLWYAMEGVESDAATRIDPVHFGNEDKMKLSISSKLRDVMVTVDLDETTTKFLRQEVEKSLGVSLAPYREYFNKEVLRILGQMDAPSEILDYLYLGSEWNASNLDELREKGIGYILNITREIDNFFTGSFQYMNVRVYDNLEADLLKYWEKTFRFIDKARKHNSRVLVHCKMGISRSASTVIAYLMKEKRWTAEEAYHYVKKQRNCARPNENFMDQLKTYEGILTASNQRDYFRSQQITTLSQVSEESEEDDQDNSFYLESIMPLRTSTSESDDSHAQQAPNSSAGGDLLQMESDLETGSRSADSMEESLPDIPSPNPDSQDTRPPQPLTSGEFTFGDGAQGRQSLLPPDEGGSSRPGESGVEIPLAEGELPPSTLTQAQAQAQISLRIRPDNSWIRPGDVSPVVAPNSANLLESTLLQSQASAAVFLKDSSPPTLPQPQTQPQPQPQPSQLPQHHSSASPEKTPLGQTVSAPLPMEISSLPISPRISSSSFEKGEDSEMPLVPPSSSISHRLGIAQYYTREKIPWHPGTVRKIKSEIDRTGQLPLGEEEEMDCSGSSQERQEAPEKMDVQTLRENLAASKPESASSVPSSAAASMQQQQQQFQQQKQQHLLLQQQQQQHLQQQQQQELQQQQKQQQLQQQQLQQQKQQQQQLQQQQQQQQLVQPQPLINVLLMAGPSQGTLHTSSSCVEMRAMETARETPPQERRPPSVYEKEDIPLTPGVVLRTKQEIEERQKLDELLGARPVQRSSSLKEGREASRSRHSQRRKTCTPILSPSTPYPNTPTPSSPTNGSPTPGASSLHPPLLPLERALFLPGEEDEDLEESKTGEGELGLQDMAVIKVGSEEFPLEVGKVKRHKKDFEHKSDDVRPRGAETPSILSTSDQSPAKRDSPSHRQQQSTLPTPTPTLSALTPTLPTPNLTHSPRFSPDPYQPACHRAEKPPPKAEETGPVEGSVRPADRASARRELSSGRQMETTYASKDPMPRKEDPPQWTGSGTWLDKSRSKSEPTSYRPKDSPASQSDSPKKAENVTQAMQWTDRGAPKPEVLGSRQADSSLTKPGTTPREQTPLPSSPKKADHNKSKSEATFSDSQSVKGEQGRNLEPGATVWRGDRGSSGLESVGQKQTNSPSAKTYLAKHNPVYSQPWPGLDHQKAEPAPHSSQPKLAHSSIHSYSTTETSRQQSLPKCPETVLPGALDQQGLAWGREGFAASGREEGDWSWQQGSGTDAGAWRPPTTPGSRLGSSSSYSSCNSETAVDRHRRLVNKRMLDMIRKIGSELTLGPERADEEERNRPCTSQVKSLVREIEQNSPEQRPPFKVVIIDHESSPQPLPKGSASGQSSWDNSHREMRASSVSRTQAVRPSPWTPSDPVAIPRLGITALPPPSAPTAQGAVSRDRPSSLSLLGRREMDAVSLSFPGSSVFGPSSLAVTPSPTRSAGACTELDASVVRHLVGRFESQRATPCLEPGKQFQLSSSWESPMPMLGEWQPQRLSSSVDENDMQHAAVLCSSRPQPADLVHGGRGLSPQQDQEMVEARSVMPRADRVAALSGDRGFQQLSGQPGPAQLFHQSPFYNTM